jgi:hypothetical protein
MLRKIPRNVTIVCAVILVSLLAFLVFFAYGIELAPILDICSSLDGGPAGCTDGELDDFARTYGFDSCSASGPGGMICIDIFPLKDPE